MQIFILGTQRSGTQLLRMLLNASGLIATPPTAQILAQMTPFESFYLNNSFPELVDDICKLIESNEPSWDLSLDRRKIIYSCRQQSFLGIMEVIYNIYMEAEKKSHWCSKCSGNIHHLNKIDEYFKSPKYIYIYRDGRDVATSFKQAPIGEKHIYHLAKKWNTEQSIINNFIKKKEKINIFTINYELLTNNPKLVIKNLFIYLGIKPENDPLSYYKGKEAKKSANSSILWENLTLPIISNNNKKYLSKLSLEEIIIFESIAHSSLELLGYPLYCKKRHYINTWNKEEIKNFDKINIELKENILSKISDEETIRHKVQHDFMRDLEKKNSI